MTFETVYEISKHPFPTFIVVVLGFLIAMVVYLKNEFKEYREKDVVTSKESAKLIGYFLICILLMVLLIVEGKGGGMPQRYANAYYSGDYEVVEGEITDYRKIKAGLIEFYVEGEWFVMDKLINNPVPKDGYLRVSFVRDSYDPHTTEIVKLEIAKE